MDFLDENIQKSIKKGLKSMTQIIYNEMYVYVWFICIYHVLLVIIVLTNLVLLAKMMLRTQTPFSIHSFPNPSSINTFQLPSSMLHTQQQPHNFETFDLSELDNKISGFVSIS
jgi:hypothetical protein